MTKNVYRSAQGKMIDMGALTLQNEMTRAVGNMNVNARGDRVNETNQVIDQRNRQVQRQVRRQTNMSNDPVHSSTVVAKQALVADPVSTPALVTEEVVEEIFTDKLPAVEEIVEVAKPAPVDIAVDQGSAPASGLAAALAKAKTVKQTLDPTAKQKAQAQGVRKL